MKRIFLLICLILPTYAAAQDVAANKPAPKPAAKEEKAKPVILDAGKLQELRLVTLERENLTLKLEQLRAQAEKLQADAKKADDNVTAFWAKLGIKREDLDTKWQAANGVDGAIILTPKVEDKKN
jgi:hypothetical protein